jgi:choline kinase
MVKRALILAAGKGTRMASYSTTCSKPLLEFKNEALLSRQLRSFNEAGVKEFVIVGGYMMDKMEAFVKNLKYDVKLIYNPFYGAMNSIGSLWFAREYLTDDVFITNGDTYCDKSIFLKLRNANNSRYVFGIDASKKHDADYRVTVANDFILDMGKDIPENETEAEYIGIALIRKKGVGLFKDLLEKVVRSGNYNLWWEDLFLELMAKDQKISYVDVTGDLWFEVDEIKDYRKYQRCF